MRKLNLNIDVLRGVIVSVVVVVIVAWLFVAVTWSWCLVVVMAVVVAWLYVVVAWLLCGCYVVVTY